MAADAQQDKIVSSYAKWAETGGPEEDFVNTGDNEVARALGRARYLLDTVMLPGEASVGHADIRAALADLLDAGMRSDMATLVRG